MKLLNLSTKGKKTTGAESARRVSWHSLFWVLFLAGAWLTTIPAHGQQIYWTDSYASVKKLGVGGTVETVVVDFETPFGLAIDVGPGKMYWASAEIERANLDGTDRELVVFSGILHALGIDIDSVNGKVYWADNQANAVSRANLDGTGVEVVVSEYSVLDVAVDPIGGKVYWNANSVSLKRANLDGTNVEILLGNNPSIGDIDIDPIQHKIYWDHFVSGRHFIRRANLDGTMIQTVAQGASHSGNLALGLDTLARKVYWGQCGVATPEGERCAMQRVNFDGSQKELVVITGIENWDAFYDIEVIPDPGELCDLALKYTDETLNLDFQIANSAPATWNLWLSVQNKTIPLWSIPLPVVGSPLPVDVPISGVPSIGAIGFLTTLTRPADGIVCSDWATVNTGSGAATATLLQQLKELFRVHVPQPGR